MTYQETLHTPDKRSTSEEDRRQRILQAVFTRAVSLLREEGSTLQIGPIIRHQRKFVDRPDSGQTKDEREVASIVAGGKLDRTKRVFVEISGLGAIFVQRKRVGDRDVFSARKIFPILQYIDFDIGGVQRREQTRSDSYELYENALRKFEELSAAV